MTFVAGEPPSLKGVWFAVEGSPAAVRAARAMAARTRCQKLHHRARRKGSLSCIWRHAFAHAGVRTRGRGAGWPARRNQCPGRAPHHGADRTAHSPKRFAQWRGEVVQRAAGSRRCRTVALHLESLDGSPESLVYRALMEYANGALPVKRRDEDEKAPAPSRHKSRKTCDARRLLKWGEQVSHLFALGAEVLCVALVSLHVGGDALHHLDSRSLHGIDFFRVVG